MATFTLRAMSCDDELGAALDDALGTLGAWVGNGFLGLMARRSGVEALRR